MIPRIAWASVIRRPLTTILCVLLITFGTGIISLILLVNDQMEQKFANDLAGTDVVLGAKGSPLQLVLSAVYHLDAPTGNISIAEAQPYLENPLVKQAVPLAYGDTYAGYRILGTTEGYLEKYGGTLASGAVFAKSMEAVIGAEVALQTGLKVGDTFLGAHGETADADVHATHPYKVVGIVERAGNVLDRLLLTPVESVWEVHGEHDHGDDHAEHSDHDHDDDHDHGAHTDEEITAVLLSFHSKRSVLTLPRIINQGTRMQAVLPALEINRLFYLLGIGTDALRLLAGGLMLVASISILVYFHEKTKEIQTRAKRFDVCV